MSGKVKFIDYQEALSTEVGKFLLSEGFSLATCTGMAEYLSKLRSVDSIGILLNDPHSMKPRKRLIGLIKQKPRREFLGTIWLKNSSRGADKQNWVFDLNGQENVRLSKKLAKIMSSTFNTKITIRLVNKNPKFEIFLSDVGYC